MLAIFLLQAAGVDAALATYRARTTAVRRCERSADSTDVTVCGLRSADRFRVPLIEPTPGDPLHEAVAAERQRYLARTDNCREKSLYLVGCGSWGPSMTAGGGKGARVTGQRPIAP